MAPQHVAHAAQQLDSAVAARFGAGVERRNGSRIRRAGYVQRAKTPQQVAKARCQAADEHLIEQADALRLANDDSRIYIDDERRARERSLEL